MMIMKMKMISLLGYKSVEQMQYTDLIIIIRAQALENNKSLLLLLPPSSS